jgi:hypothetical protein
MEVSGKIHALAGSRPGKVTGTNRIGGWVGGTASLDSFGEKYIISYLYVLSSYVTSTSQF